ncbi:hypothetical protein K503DRAFT_165137 [Rhizopogon vinicolor AM-OR11-026]|uniref:Uncharacterized protein n=1 Tax=Rhizopogon vinicolor AM-OR11-026 TaxID=1314800 RepID=A0A1B7N0G4_9AGAM|nr:hypothetical protein K503DRAFT_165137 [Rhizopogon vinicolor AM-OR11-026]
MRTMLTRQFNFHDCWLAPIFSFCLMGLQGPGYYKLVIFARVGRLPYIEIPPNYRSHVGVGILPDLRPQESGSVPHLGPRWGCPHWLPRYRPSLRRRRWSKVRPESNYILYIHYLCSMGCIMAIPHFSMRSTFRILEFLAQLHIPRSFRSGFILAVKLRRQKRIDIHKLHAVSTITYSCDIAELSGTLHNTCYTTCVSYGIKTFILVHMMNWLALMLGECDELLFLAS